MANTSVIRLAGQTRSLSVTDSSTSATLIDDNTNDQVNFCSFLNTGSVAVAVKFGDSAMSAAVLPSGATLGDYVLPANMNLPLVIACPTTPFYVRAIGAAAGPSLVYITPVADQS